MTTDRAQFLAERIAQSRQAKVGTTTAVRALAPRALLPKIAAVAEAERVAFAGYCGVWRHTTLYEKGDAVTFGGSLWLATRDPEGEKPAGGGAWKLVCKKGAAGADGRDAELVDALAIYSRDRDHITTRVDLRALDSNELLAVLTPTRDAEGFIERATIKWA